MQTKYRFEDEESAFSLVEEPRFYRLRVERSAIEEEHVEEFLDRTVEWLSKNPLKGLLIDFKKVKSVCDEFSLNVRSYYEDIRNKGLKVRFVNVDPDVKAHISEANISVVLKVNSGKIILSARILLEDLSRNLSDEELMKKHKLSPKGLASLFRKLFRKGLISRQALAKRMGVETCEITVPLDGQASKIRVSTADVLKDLGENASETDLMQKYKLSPRGLRSLLMKLYRKGLIPKPSFGERKSIQK